MTGDYSWAAVRINRIFATGLRAAPQYGFGLRRRNNEFNELTNCWAARGRRVRINRIFAVRYIRAALRGLKAQQVRSPGQRPGLTYVPHLRPVRAKVINNRCAHTFALTGRGALYSGTQGVALGYELAALSGRSRRYRQPGASYSPASPEHDCQRPSTG